ncbi:MAG: SGNH/GDSL hydrolase family protein [Oscillospiraceae bacterium]|nr:SGNH/GDSL hydrolase family protein [Oscillospiraceae bacterium]
MNITIYGDSILKGVLLEDGKYRVNREWEQQFTAAHGLTIRNKAHFGSTIGKAMSVIEKDSAKEYEPGELAVLEFGGNDCDFDWAAIAEHPTGVYACKTPPTQFVAEYREAVRLIRKSGRRPVALTLPPIHSRSYLRFICRDGLNQDNILRWLGDVEAITRWQAHYSALIESIAGMEKLELIDLRKVFLKDGHSPEELLCADGIHPSRLGQELIFRTLSAAMA